MSFKALTQAERIASLEVQVTALSETVKSMDSKMDELLALKNKGAGVFWLASILVGSGVVGAIGVIVSWFRG